MGLTVKEHTIFGGLRVVLGEHTMPASYATGGDGSDPPGLVGLWGVLILPASDGRKYEYDLATKKILAKFYDYDAAADGVAIQVPAGTDLSGTTLKLIFIAPAAGQPEIQAFRGPGI